MKKLKILMIAGILVLMAGIVSLYADGSKDVKEKCPTCQSVKINKDLSAKYEGTTYYFCCEGCKTTFEKNPAKYVKASMDKSDKKCSDKSKCCDSKKKAEGKTCPANKGKAKEASAIMEGGEKACCEGKKM